MLQTVNTYQFCIKKWYQNLPIFNAVCYLLHLEVRFGKIILKKLTLTQLENKRG